MLLLKASNKSASSSSLPIIRLHPFIRLLICLTRSSLLGLPIVPLQFPSF